MSIQKDCVYVCFIYIHTHIYDIYFAYDIFIIKSLVSLIYRDLWK